MHGVKWEVVPGTKNQVSIPKRGALDVCFHEQARVSKWPQIISGDAGHYSIKLFSDDLAKKMESAGFSGIEFCPVNFELGNLKGLKGKEALCPRYVWGRVGGIVLVDLFLGDQYIQLDPSGKFTIEEPPIGQYWKMRLREQQPTAADFSRVVPGAISKPVVTPRVAEFFDPLELKELRITAVGNGWL